MAVIGKSPEISTEALDESALRGDLVQYQLEQRQFERTQVARGLAKYENVWVEADEVESVMCVALRHLVYSHGTSFEREERIRKSAKSESVEFTYAIMDKNPKAAHLSAIHTLGRRRALKIWQKFNLFKKRPAEPTDDETRVFILFRSNPAWRTDDIAAGLHRSVGLVGKIMMGMQERDWVFRDTQTRGHWVLSREGQRVLESL